MFDEYGRKRVLLELVVILAIVTIENWKNRDVIPEENIDNKPIRAYTDYKLQAMIDSVRIARELGANSEYEMELKVVAEGKKYGAIKKAYFEAFHMPVFSCDSGLYFDELSEEEQPGIHVRRVGGREPLRSDRRR